MSHPSEEVIQEARWRLELRNRSLVEVERYRDLSRQFRAESEFDSFGLRQCLLEMERLADTAQSPPRKGLKGRLGALIVPQNGAAGVPARVLKAVDAILRHQDQRQRELEMKLSDLESRIKKIEGGQG